MAKQSYYEHLFGVRDKVVLVTGGTRGIGRMIAEGMVRCGARTYIASRKEDACREAEVQLSEFCFCKAMTADISNLEGCQRLAETLREHEESLEVLINNAGVTWSQKIEEFTEKAWDLDLKSPFFLSQQVLELLKVKASPQNRSVIINISSVNGIKPSGLQNYSYVAAKAGLQQLSAQMARDLNEDNINVNVIAPGPYKSKMTAPLYSSPEVEAEVMSNFSMGRWGAIEDAAGLSIFLSSKAGSFITGSVIASDGGDTNLG